MQSIYKFYSSDEYSLLYEKTNYLAEHEKLFDRGDCKYVFETLSPAMQKLRLSTVLEVGGTRGE